jgi:hypothetical protein
MRIASAFYQRISTEVAAAGKSFEPSNSATLISSYPEKPARAKRSPFGAYA